MDQNNIWYTDLLKVKVDLDLMLDELQSQHYKGQCPDKHIQLVERSIGGNFNLYRNTMYVGDESILFSGYNQRANQFVNFIHFTNNMNIRDYQLTYDIAMR